MAVSNLLSVAILLAAGTILTIVFTLKSNPETTISLNAAKHKMAFIFLALGISLALVLSSLWYFQWFMAAYDLPLLSHLTFSTIIGSFLVAVWLPDTAGWRRNVHRLAAYVAVLLIPIFLLSVAFNLVILWHIYVLLAAVLLQAAMIYLLFFVPAARKYFLPLQGVYLASFFVVLLTLTYTINI